MAVRLGDEKTGTVLEAMPNHMFRVELESGRVIRCHLSSEARMRLTRVLPGDKVTIRLSPLDDSRGRIIECEARG